MGQELQQRSCKKKLWNNIEPRHQLMIQKSIGSRCKEEK